MGNRCQYESTDNAIFDLYMEISIFSYTESKKGFWVLSVLDYWKRPPVRPVLKRTRRTPAEEG